MSTQTEQMQEIPQHATKQQNAIHSLKGINSFQE